MRKRWGRSVVTILQQLGVPIGPKEQAQIAHEREVDPSATTADIVQRLSLAPPELVTQAVALAKAEGSTEILADRFLAAKLSLQEAAEASLQLRETAQAISDKGSS